MSLQSELELLKAVPIARDIDSKPWHISIEGQHVFIAGRTGGGKNSWTWSLVLLLALAWKVGLVRFWGIDPKRIELSIGRGWWDYYADTDEGMVELLELCVQEMQQRMTGMQGVRRRFVPSQETPLNVIIIDELAYLSVYMPDKKLRDRADKAVRTLLTQGRAPGYAVVAAIQDPRVESCGYRNLFPLRIAGGLNEPRQVDMVLGEGMHDAGAYCEMIPFGIEGAGVAYVLDAEHMNKPLLVRVPWCDDAVIQRVLMQIGQRVVSTAYQVKDENVSSQLTLKSSSWQQFQYSEE